jgi:hypothetical protein
MFLHQWTRNLPALQLFTPRGPGVESGITRCCSGVANRTCDFLLCSGFMGETVSTTWIEFSIVLSEGLFIPIGPLFIPPLLVWLQLTGSVFVSSGFRVPVVSDCPPLTVIDGSSEGTPRVFNASIALCGSSHFVIQ